MNRYLWIVVIAGLVAGSALHYLLQHLDFGVLLK